MVFSLCAGIAMSEIIKYSTGDVILTASLQDMYHLLSGYWMEKIGSQIAISGFYLKLYLSFF